MIDGLLVAVPTPFAVGGLAEQAFAEHLAWQIEQGAAGLSPCGITGEGSTLSAKEQTCLIDIAVETAAKRALLIPATGTNSTDSTIKLTRQAKRAGADAVLIVVPYYSRPSQEGIWRHFEAVARAVDVPILVHNAAARTAVELPPATVARLATIPSVVGIVDDDGGPRRSQVIADFVDGAFQQLCGSDEQVVTAMSNGHSGRLSNLANIAPNQCVSLQRACMVRDYDAAFGLQAALNRFRTGLGNVDETAAIKFLRTFAPGFNRSVRLPLTGVPDEAVSQIKAAFDALGVDASRVSPSPSEMPGSPHIHSDLGATAQGRSTH